MNILPDETIALLAAAYNERMSHRRAAVACDVHRNSVERYFRHFNGHRAAEPPARKPKPEPTDEMNGQGALISLAKKISSPTIVREIDDVLRELIVQHEELLILKRIATRLHGPAPRR